MSTPLLQVEYIPFIVDNWKIYRSIKRHTARIYLEYCLFFKYPQAVRKNYPQFIISYAHCKHQFTFQYKRHNCAISMLTRTLVFIVKSQFIHNSTALSYKVSTGINGIFPPAAKNIHILATSHGTECGYLVDKLCFFLPNATILQDGSNLRGHQWPAIYNTAPASAILRPLSARH